MSQNEIDEHLDMEFVMRWVGIILADTTWMDNATMAQAFRQLNTHLESHIDTLATEKA